MTSMSMIPQTQVKNTPAQMPSFTPTRSLLLQRKCACGGTPGVDGECAECRRKRLALQARSTGQPQPATVPPIVHEVLRSPGQPLDQATRSFMEPRFGHDFSKVRVHTDARAAQSARAVNALAYTVGRDVVFGMGRYVPETNEGRSLLAHELTHTIQQHADMRRFPTTLEITSPRDRAEQEAHTAASAIVRGESFAPKPGEPMKIARQEPSSAPAPKSIPPTVFEHKTELGGLTVGNFDFHFRECGILVWVWLKFKFSKDISPFEQANFKKRFFNAVHSKWAHSGYSLVGKGNCPCGSVPIEIHAEENTGSFYHKLVDVKRKTDEKRRPKVIRDINVNLDTDDPTLAHEFGHVLGLYDEYVGPWWENIWFWHKNRPDGPNALMFNQYAGELRPRYFEHYRRRVQKTAPKGCEYKISSPVPPV